MSQEISVKVSADTQNYIININNAEKQTSSFNEVASKLSSNIASSFKTAFSVGCKALSGIATAMGNALVAGVKYNAEIEQYQTSFEVMTGSAKKAEEIMGKLSDLGAKTSFETSDLADVTQLLMNYGFTAEDAISKMTMLGDISQGSADKMNSIAKAYGQMSSSGKVQLNDINEMIDAGFNPLQEISESTGESMASLYDRISKGTLSVDEITASMQRSTAEGGKFFQATQKQSETLAGQFSTLKENALQFLGAFSQSSSEALTGDILPIMNDGLYQMTDKLKKGDMSALGTIGGDMVAAILTSAAAKLPELITTGVSLFSSAFSGIASSLPGVLPALFANLGTLFETQVPILISSFTMMFSSVITGLSEVLPVLMPQLIAGLSLALQSILLLAPQLLQMGITLLMSLANGITQQIPTLIPTIVSVLLMIVETLTNPDNLAGLISAGLNMIVTLAQALVCALPSLLGALPMIIKGVVGGLIELLPQLIPIGFQMMITIASSLVSQIGTIISALPAVFSAIIGAFKEADWKTIGRDIIIGLINGLRSMLSNLWSAVSDIAHGIADTFKNLLGIHSPSKLFFQFGEYVDEGFIGGVRSKVPEIANTIQSLPVMPSYEGKISADTSIDGLGDYIVAAVVNTSRIHAQQIAKGISEMKMTANGREVGRFVADLGFKR